MFEVYFHLLIKWLGRKFPQRMQAVQLFVQKPELGPGMRESRGHLFPTHFYYSLGIMQACSWQINTRPYEVAVPAELKNMRRTAINFSVPQFAASDAFKSHDPLMQMVISHFVKRNALSRLPAPAWAHIPVWSGNTFLHYIGCVLCSVNNVPTLCCSVKTVIQHLGSVTLLFHSLASNQSSRTTCVQFIPHYELCELYSDMSRPY